MMVHTDKADAVSPEDSFAAILSISDRREIRQARLFLLQCLRRVLLHTLMIRRPPNLDSAPPGYLARRTARRFPSRHSNARRSAAFLISANVLNQNSDAPALCRRACDWRDASIIVSIRS